MVLELQGGIRGKASAGGIWGRSDGRVGIGRKGRK